MLRAETPSIGGRIQHTEMASTTKCPILLQQHSYLTRLIVDHYHGRYLHPASALNTVYTQINCSTELILQQQSNWTRDSPALTVLTLVIIKDDFQPPTRWWLGSISKVHLGSDDIVRVATIWTSTYVGRKVLRFTNRSYFKLKLIHFGGGYVSSSPPRSVQGF